MNKPADLSSLALPDSPAEIGKEFREALRKAIRFGGYQTQANSDAVDEAITSFYVTLGKHLLTAEEARHALEEIEHQLHENKDFDSMYDTHQVVLAKLRRLSGSSRGEG